MKNSKKALIIFAVVFLLGYLDWPTTFIGLTFCGGTELNPILSNITKSSMLTFSIVKLAAVTLAGFAAYKAADIAKHVRDKWRLTNKLVNGGILLTVLSLSIVVANNMMIVFKLCRTQFAGVVRIGFKGQGLAKDSWKSA